ncbi:MAG: barstar family protein [Bacteriovoracaceae bacterium]|nr:barstar family protein [Bacteriovoracaceae bacterium]
MKMLIGLLFCSFTLYSVPANAKVYAQCDSSIHQDDQIISINICGSHVESVEEIHDIFVKALNLPTYYGRNFDALYDILTDTTVVSQSIEIKILEGNVLEAKLGESTLGSLLSVLEDAQEENPTHLRFSFSY